MVKYKMITGKISLLPFVAILCISAIGINPQLLAQQDITLENIWLTQTLATKSVPGFNFMQDGRHYTRLEDNAITRYDIASGEKVGTIFDPEEQGYDITIDNYNFGPDEEKLLITTEEEKIYRRSSLAKFYIYDRNGETLTRLYEKARQRDAAFSPDGTKVAFVSENNLYYKDLSYGTVHRITDDGKPNEIINAVTDWVYEEEFRLVKAYEWSPDGEKIAFLRFDEREVPEFTYTNYTDGLYPEYITFKYPKVGEKNSIVELKLYDLESEKITDVDLNTDEDTYIPRMKWLNAENLIVTRLNRHQNYLELLKVDAESGNYSVMMEEENEYYIDIDYDLTFLENRDEFIWSSTKDGFNHLYLYNTEGEEVRQITQGEYDVTQFYGVDEERGVVYFQAAMEDPTKREIYKVSILGGEPVKISGEAPTSSAQFSNTFDYYVLNESGANLPTTYTVQSMDEGEAIRSLEKNVRIDSLRRAYELSEVEFFQFANSTGDTLNGWMIKPPGMDEDQEYPLVMFVYGGPGSQTVLDRWSVSNYWWFQMLAQRGFIVASVDNRGTGARGEEFQKMTYLQLGKYETEDQIDAAKYLGSLPYIDEERIGIFGWSYGGYMASLAILKGNDVFNTAIAVAPVTNWKWYDTIYTERYMRTTAENEKGYKENSPVYFADRLKGNFLLIHGMGDDNVHFQHTVEMARALIEANKQFDTYYYPNKAHGIGGGTTRLHLYTKMTEFFEENLKKQHG